MKVVKNFLPKHVYRNIKETIFSYQFPWYYNENVLIPEDQLGQKPMYQFYHVFYANNEPLSKHYNFLTPIIDILNPSLICRIKANLNPRTEKIIETGLHTDDNDVRFKSAVFFLNTCDGYCKILNKKIFSEDNKMVLFNSNLEHTGSTTTNQNRRVLINFIYLPKI